MSTNSYGLVADVQSSLLAGFRTDFHNISNMVLGAEGGKGGAEGEGK